MFFSEGPTRKNHLLSSKNLGPADRVRTPKLRKKKTDKPQNRQKRIKNNEKQRTHLKNLQGLQVY